MKTIFTLLFTMAMFNTTFAQYGQKDKQDRDKQNDVYAWNDNKGNGHHDREYGGYVFTPRERDMQIDQINREYEYRIQAVKNKYFMSWFQKKRQINYLDEQRDSEIQQVIYKFKSPKNKFSDYGRRDRKRW